MSLISKHDYRFGYLQSEEWKTVRSEALARESGRCEICGEESPSNDAHHIWYPKKIKETQQNQLAVLCRGCHEFVHAVLPACKTADPIWGIEQWSRLKNSIAIWRTSKRGLFYSKTNDSAISRKLIMMDQIRGKSRAYDEYIKETENYVMIHIPDKNDPNKNHHYVCRTKFAFKASFGLLKNLPESSRLPPDRGGKNVTFGVVELQERAIVMARCGHVCEVLSARTSMGISEQAAMAYMKFLPEKWPCIITVSVASCKETEDAAEKMAPAIKEIDKSVLLAQTYMRPDIDTIMRRRQSKKDRRKNKIKNLAEQLTQSNYPIRPLPSGPHP